MFWHFLDKRIWYTMFVILASYAFAFVAMFTSMISEVLAGGFFVLIAMRVIAMRYWENKDLNP